MSTKEKILALLEEHRGAYFSGEELAQRLDISRTAIWKAVKSLQAAGYPIHAVPNKGYCLPEETDILSAQGIAKYLRPELAHMAISVYPEVSSTNTLLREQANQGAAEWSFVAANRQTAGRGRMGRTFYSPQDTGIYMSLLLRPRPEMAELAVSITTIAAVAMCEAIGEISGEEAKIKWVNDIFLRGKKVCGILTEGAFNMESGCMDYAVLGAGVNLYLPEGDFPEELANIAGAVFTEPVSDGKNRLAAAFLNRFYGYYTAGNQDYAQRYRQYSFVIGKQVTLVAGTGEREGVVEGIDDQCRLLVRYEDGTKDCFASGEIRIRPRTEDLP